MIEFSLKILLKFCGILRSEGEIKGLLTFQGTIKRLMDLTPVKLFIAFQLEGFLAFLKNHLIFTT